MPADEIQALAEALLKSGGKAAVAFGRDWAVPTITAAVRTGPENGEAGLFSANIREAQYAVGYDGTNTFMPFTANVSFIENTGISDDLVLGSGPSLLSLAQSDAATYGYQFNESSGNLINFMGNATYDLLVDAAVVRSVAGPIGNAYHIPGTSGIAPAYGHVQGTRASQNGISSITYELIAKFGATGLALEILDGEWAGLATRFQFGQDGAGNLAAYIAGGGGFNLAAPASSGLAGQWHHYVWQSDGSNITLFIDGAQKATAVSALSTNDGTGANAALAFGGLLGTGASNWNSYFAFFAAYHNTVLTPARISAHFAASGCPRP